jgi:putative two-component system response regulator
MTCTRLKNGDRHRDIPVIFLTAMSDGPKTKNAGLDLGAVDYITKPISPPIVLARVRHQLALKAQPTFCATRTSIWKLRYPAARANWRPFRT